MEFDLIVAASKDGSIGDSIDPGLLWYLPEDLRRFKTVTMNRPLIMGRKTWDSLPIKLPGRTNVVVSRRGPVEGEKTPDDVVPDLKLALEKYYRTYPEVRFTQVPMVIGGGEIYKQALELGPRYIHLTMVYLDETGDIKFPFTFKENEMQPEVEYAGHYYLQYSILPVKVNTSSEGIKYAFFDLKKITKPD